MLELGGVWYLVFMVILSYGLLFKPELSSTVVFNLEFGSFGAEFGTDSWSILLCKSDTLDSSFD
ncbi:hypothetical protein HanRHA438_Chr10g0480211 [Helianthus annuus]|nr:hypothetical protein HanRHA438_Chr10g0480211 [Helianthus annuus]